MTLRLSVLLCLFYFQEKEGLGHHSDFLDWSVWFMDQSYSRKLRRPLPGFSLGVVPAWVVRPSSFRPKETRPEEPVHKTLAVESRGVCHQGPGGSAFRCGKLIDPQRPTRPDPNRVNKRDTDRSLTMCHRDLFTIHPTSLRTKKGLGTSKSPLLPETQTSFRSKY